MSSGIPLEAQVEARIASGAIELPVFPSSAQEVIALCESADVDYKKLADVICRDATLAGPFLALANSPAFCGRMPLVSLQQALVRLGTAQAKQIAMVVACKTRAFVVPGRPELAAELLAHALTTALFAQEIARMRRLNVEEAFLAGLLHDVGKPAVMQVYGEVAKAAGPKPAAAAKSATAAPSPPTIAREADPMEACAARLHEQVGELIAKRWSMRRSIADAIALHHAPLSDAPEMQPVAIVQLADTLAHGARDAASLAAHPATNRLNLYPDDIERLIAKGAEIAEQVAGAS